MTDKWAGEWPVEELDNLDFDDTGITGNQMAWVLHKLTTFIEQGGGHSACWSITWARTTRPCIAWEECGSRMQ